MFDSPHVAIKRMLEVTTSDELLNEAEETHVVHCAECLEVFGQLVLVS